MNVSAKITNKYVALNNKGVKLLQITLKESINLNFGDTLVLNPQTPNLVRIKKAELPVYGC